MRTISSTATRNSHAIGYRLYILERENPSVKLEKLEKIVTLPAAPDVVGIIQTSGTGRNPMITTMTNVIVSFMENIEHVKMLPMQIGKKNAKLRRLP